MRLRFLIFGLGLTAAACAVHERPPGEPAPAASEIRAYEVQVMRDVRYTPDEWPSELAADIYVPQGPGPFPAVLVVHGGGWAHGSRGYMSGAAENLAEAGMVAMNISYRLAPDTQFPGQLHDLQQAMHFLHRNSQEYKVDTARIGGLGYSAGAHLVALLGVTQAGDELDSPHGGEQTRLQAVVGGGTPADLTAFAESGRLLRDFLGGTRQEFPQKYALASPITHVSPQSPPFFLYHGQWDLLVPISHARSFADALRAAGVRADFFTLRFRGHIAAALIDGSAQKNAAQFLHRELRAPSR